MKEYVATITARILAGSEGEALTQVPVSYTVHSIMQVHTAGTICSLCGQHHTQRSAQALNDGSAPVDVTQQPLETGGAVKGPAGAGPWPHEVVRYGGGA